MSHDVVGLMERLRSEVGKAIVGQREAVSLVLVGLLARGHVLIEGVPGLAKTLLAKTLAYVLGSSFTRIQFTPDLMPADIVGTYVYDLQTRRFRLRKGPIFTDIVLADEINRAPPKTQSALLEAMEERQVSIDGKTFPLPERFMVLATQNPIEQEGTYPLPEAQTDRFLLKLRLDYPTADEEREIFALYGDGREFHDFKTLGLARLPEDDWIGRCRQRARQIRLEQGIIDYAYRIVSSTRVSPHLYLGASPRGGLALLRTGQCLAALKGNDYVTPDEIKQMALSALRHRLILRPEAEMEGLTPDRIIRQILETLPVPR